ncbi:MAG: LytTR family transcriptional regulator [Rhizobiaceae bacterium]|nr:LytTR family transcriptional regulator [Rhizobiaceae bacterium]
MSDSTLQSALRQMRVVGRSPRLWLTFGAVVLLFAVTAPFGTEKIAFIPRLAYWLSLHAASWSIALTFALGGGTLLRSLVGNLLARMLLGSLIAALPIGLVVALLELAWFGTPPDLPGYIREVAVSLPLCGIFCVLSYLTMSGAPSAGEAQMEEHMAGDPREIAAAEPEQPALLRRLRPQNRGRLLHISVADHYSMVRTSGGSELILLRFSDTIREVGLVDGMQVHRSHWVARDFVLSIRSAGGKVILALGDGSEIPVSRTFAASARRWLNAPSRPRPPAVPPSGTIGSR